MDKLCIRFKLIISFFSYKASPDGLHRPTEISWRCDHSLPLIFFCRMFTIYVTMSLYVRDP